MHRSKTKKQYKREFTIMAVELSSTREHMAGLAQELGIRPQLNSTFLIITAIHDARISKSLTSHQVPF